MQWFQQKYFNLPPAERLIFLNKFHERQYQKHP